MINGANKYETRKIVTPPGEKKRIVYFLKQPNFLIFLFLTEIIGLTAHRVPFENIFQLNWVKDDKTCGVDSIFQVEKIIKKNDR